MSTKTKDLLLIELFKNKSISYSTIDSLLKYGFDSNETLLTLDFDLDFPQMPDICLSQKCLLRQLLTDYRKQYNSNSIKVDKTANVCQQLPESDDCLRENNVNESCLSFGDSPDIPDSPDIGDDSVGLNEIFYESESIVKSIKQRQQQNQQNLNTNTFNTNKNRLNANFLILNELTFEPIVDQLRESLIRVEKQKQEKDLVLRKQRIELRVKDLELNRLQAELKQLQNQLICEKLKVEKLNYKLIKCNNHFLLNNSSVDHNCNNSLDDFKAVYYNNSTNHNHNNDSDCDQLSSGADDPNPRLSTHCTGSPPNVEKKSNFVNYWTEVDTNSTKITNKTKNLDEFKTCLFTTYVSTHTQSTGMSNDGTNDGTICIDLDDGSDKESSTAPSVAEGFGVFGAFDNKSNDKNVNQFDNNLKTYQNFRSINESNECATTGDEVVVKQEFAESDEEEEMSGSEESLVKFGPEVESIVCCPDIDCDNNTTNNTINTDNNSNSNKSIENNQKSLNKTIFTSKPNPMSIIRLNNTKPIESKQQNRNPKSKSVQCFKQYRCHYDECTYSFVSSEGLKRHIRSVHTKEKPFKCHFNDCQKCFGRSDALKEHMKRHLGLKLFKCDYSDCDFDSVSSNSLKRHIISIHLKQKHFKCLYENCDKTFGRKDSLKKHMEKQHLICDSF